MPGSPRQDPDSDARPKAFVSWAHGTEDWERTVLDFATAMRRTGGVDADLDLWHYTDHENWTTYGPNAIAESDFILIAFDAAYKLRWEGNEELGKGAGAAREAAAIKAIFERDQEEFVRRVKPIVLPGADTEDIPNDVYGVAERFIVGTFDEKGLDGLLRSIFGKPYDPVPPLGPLPALPPRFVDEIQQSPPPTNRQGAAAASQPNALGADEAASEESSIAARLKQIDNALESFRPEDMTGNMALQPNRHWDQLMRERAQVSASLEALQRSERANVPGSGSLIPEHVRPETSSLDDLTEQVRGRLENTASADVDLARRARNDVSIDTIAALFRRAQELAGISTEGLRVEAPGRWERLRFQMPWSQIFPGAPPVFRVSVEPADGSASRVPVFWSGGQTPVDMLAALVEAWKRAGEYPGNAAVDPKWIFEHLIGTIEVVIESRSKGGDTQLDPVIELLGSNWVMTDYGLEHLPTGYLIDRGRLLTEKAVAGWREHMSEKVWVVEEDELAHKSNHEPDFWMVSEIAHRFFAAHKDDD